MARTKLFGRIKYLIALIVLIALFLSCFVTPWVRQERRMRNLAVIRAELNRALDDALDDVCKMPYPSKTSIKWCTDLIKTAYNNVTYNISICIIDRDTSIEQMSRLLVDLKGRTRPVSSTKERDELLKWLWDRLAESGHCGREQAARHRPVFERCLR